MKTAEHSCPKFKKAAFIALVMSVLDGLWILKLKHTLLKFLHNRTLETIFSILIEEDDQV